MSTRVSNEPEQGQGVITIPLSQIQVNSEENMRRVDPKKTPTLAKSIQEVGLLQPLVVKPLIEHVNGFQYRLDAGYRRMAAIVSLDWSEVPAMVVSADTSSRKVNMVENGQREEPNYIELAKAIKVRMEEGAKVKEIADDLGKSPAYVSQILPLIDPEKMRPHIQKAVAEGKFILKLARLLPGMSEEEQDKALADVDALGEGGKGAQSEMAESATKKRKKKKGETRGRKPKTEKGEGASGISAKKALLLIGEAEGEVMAASRVEDISEERKAACKDAIWTLRLFEKFLSGGLGAQALGKKLTNKMEGE